MLAFVATALAHVPHQDCVALLVPPEGSELPWFSVGRPQFDSAVLYRSDDEGRTWEPQSRPLVADIVYGGGYTDDGVAVVLGEGRYWWSVDGEEWNATALPAAAERLAVGEGIAFAFADAIGVGQVGGELVPERLALATIAAGPGGFAGVDAEGQVWTSGEGSLGAPKGTMQAAVPAGDAAFVGTLDGSVWRWEAGEWNRCGDLPFGDIQYADVASLATDGATLLAFRAGGGPAVSVDGCQTWEDRRAPVYIDIGGEGGAPDSTATFPEVDVRGDTWVVGGYAGVAITRDAGLSWERAMTLTPEYTRGVALSPHAVGVAWIAAYGSGPVHTTDGGVTFSANGVGIDGDANAQMVAFDLEDPLRMHALVGYQPYLSVDGGQTWARNENAPTHHAKSLVTGPGGRVWLAELQADEGFVSTVARSDDGGETWSGLAALDEGIDGQALDAYDRAPFACALTSASVWCESGDTWTSFSPEGGVRAVTSVGERLIVAGDGGIWLDEQRVWDAGDDAVVAIASEGDAVFAGTRAGHILTSEDAGESWADAGLQVGAEILDLRIRDGLVLVGGYAGAFLLRDGALERWPAYQRLDDITNFLWCPDCAREENASGALGQVMRVPAGVSLTANVRGSTIRILGGCDERTEMIVSIDGEAQSIALAEVAVPSVLFEASLGDGWHRLEVSAAGGSGLVIDGVEGIGVTTPFAQPFAEEPSPAAADECGCDGGSAFLLVPLFWRRRWSA